MQQNFGILKNEAVCAGELLLLDGYIRHITDDEPFADEAFYYQFTGKHLKMQHLSTDEGMVDIWKSARKPTAFKVKQIPASLDKHQPLNGLRLLKWGIVLATYEGSGAVLVAMVDGADYVLLDYSSPVREVQHALSHVVVLYEDGEVLVYDVDAGAGERFRPCDSNNDDVNLTSVRVDKTYLMGLSEERVYLWPLDELAYGAVVEIPLDYSSPSNTSHVYDPFVLITTKVSFTLYFLAEIGAPPVTLLHHEIERGRCTIAIDHRPGVWLRKQRTYRMWRCSHPLYCVRARGMLRVWLHRRHNVCQHGASFSRENHLMCHNGFLALLCSIH